MVASSLSSPWSSPLGYSWSSIVTGRGLGDFRLGRKLSLGEIMKEECKQVLLCDLAFIFASVLSFRKFLNPSLRSYAS